MIPFDEALGIVRSTAQPVGIISRRLEEAAHGVLAQDCVATESSPRFDSSAMDGFAVRAADLSRAAVDAPVRLVVDGTLRAGDADRGRVKRGRAVRIMTGAQIPTGCDAVVQKEHIGEEEGTILCTRPARTGDHIRRCGDEFRAGDTVFAHGTPISPAVAGVLAALGQLRVRVYKHPRVSLVITGSEITDRGGQLRPGQIRDANSWSIAFALRQLGIECRVCHAADRLDELTPLLRQELRQSDLLITTGGVSVGEYDFVRRSLYDLGVAEHFWRVAMKPGKPVFFGSRGRRLVFGLPGNPVSALLACFLFVRPALLGMLGVEGWQAGGVQARLGAAVQGSPDRSVFLRVAFENDGGPVPRAMPVREQGSHMLTGMARAHGLLQLPLSRATLPEGRLITVQPFSWGIS